MHHRLREPSHRLKQSLRVPECHFCFLLQFVGIALVIFSGFAIDEVIWHWHHREAYFYSSMHGVAMVLGVAQVATSVLLGLGAVKENPKLLQPWLVFFSVQTVLLLLAMLATCVVIIIYVEPLPIGISLFLITITYCYTFRYFILVVYSYYRQLNIVTHGQTAGVMQLA
ncbi:Protein of unknown function [Gryllus bimaculatus]|nr:Protein of unknown function [Gryllus bimaculatus]